MVGFDALRRKRNLSDYSGEEVNDGSVVQCIDDAERLLQDVTRWIARNRSDLTST